MSETVMEYMAKFGLDTSELASGVTGAAISFDALQMAAEKVFDGIKEGFEATIGAAAEFGDTIQKQANILGDTTDNIQRLRAAALATDTDFQSATQSVKMFSQRVEEGGAAGDTLRQKITDMGVSLTDQNGNLKSATELFMEINAHLGSMPDVFERNNLAMAVYGRSWSNVANMIADGTAAAAAFNSAQPISADNIKAMDDFDIQLKEMNAQLSMGGVTIGMELMPAAKEWMKIVDEMLQKGAPLEQIFTDLNTVLVDAARGFNLVGFSAQAMWDMLVNHNMDAFKQDLQNEANYIQSTATSDKLAAQGYIEGAGQTYNAATGKWEGGTTSTTSGGSSSSGSSSGTSSGGSASGGGTTTTSGGGGAPIPNGNTYIGVDSTGHAQYSTNPYYDKGAIENQGITSGADISSMIQNTNFGTGANDYTGTSWETGQKIYDSIVKFAKTDTTGNPILAQIASFDANDYNIVNGEQYNPNYSFGSGAQTGVQYVQSLMDQYTASKNPVINTVVNVPAGSDAQTIANATAEAISRALARQVST